MSDFSNFSFDLPQLLLVLFNVETADSAYRQCQKFIDIIVGNIAPHQLPERSESGVNFGILLFLGFALFNPLIYPVFKEYLRQSFGMKKFILPVQCNLQLSLQILKQFFRIAVYNPGNAHHRRPVLPDYR